MSISSRRSRWFHRGVSPSTQTNLKQTNERSLLHGHTQALPRAQRADQWLTNPRRAPPRAPAPPANFLHARTVHAPRSSAACEVGGRLARCPNLDPKDLAFILVLFLLLFSLSLSLSLSLPCEGRSVGAAWRAFTARPRTPRQRPECSSGSTDRPPRAERERETSSSGTKFSAAAGSGQN